jgi:hypothetical protein
MKVIAFVIPFSVPERRVAQHDWMTANLSKVIKIQDLASLRNAACQASVTATNITTALAKPCIRPFSRLAFSDEDFVPLVGRPTDNEVPNQEITIPSASNPVPREISGSGKDSLLPEDVRPFPEPGQTYERRQTKKIKSHILTDSLIKRTRNTCKGSCQ